MSELKENTVQQTLCLPLCGRMIAAQKYPAPFPNRDAERIVHELGQDISGQAIYRLQYMWMNCVIRQYIAKRRLHGCLTGPCGHFT